MSTLAASLPIHGWGRYPIEECEVYRPERLDELCEIVARAPHSLIPRGLGRSYGDAALNAGRGVIQSDRLDRMIEFDDETGVLHCEAAVSLAQIIATFLPRGFFFPITPGSKQITVGGAIAADVHGKNHHASGSMSSALIDFQLLTASGEVLRCSREENPEVFWATVGGMGLTGFVLEARMRLLPVETAFVEVQYERLPDLDRALERCAELDRGFDYGVAWTDSLATGRSLGRSVMLSANHAPLEALPAKRRANPHHLPGAFRPAVPFLMPELTLSRPSMRIFNAGIWAAHPPRHALVDADRFFYPLDRVVNWNRIYGRRGVLQWQCALPAETAREGLTRVLETMSASGVPSFLTVLKSFGPKSEGLLSFPRPGFTLALDLPNTGETLRRTLRGLDEMIAARGGRMYLAKDACLEPELFGEMYPDLPRFQEVKAKIDPSDRFSSSQARRLGIVRS